MAAASGTRADSPVREARKKKYDRLVDAAEAIGISVGYLSMIENGYVPNEQLRGRIADTLEVPPSQLWPGVCS